LLTRMRKKAVTEVLTKVLKGHSVANVMGGLEGLLSDQRYKKRSVELSTRFDSQAEISKVCNFLEIWKRACPLRASRRSFVSRGKQVLKGARS